jgi:hypothetical protein
MAVGRSAPVQLTPLYRISDAPPEALVFLNNAALALGHGAVFLRWWCPACQRVFAWTDMIAGQVQGSQMWLPICPTDGCRGIDWLNLRDYDRERARHPDWPPDPVSGQSCPA